MTLTGLELEAHGHTEEALKTLARAFEWYEALAPDDLAESAWGLLWAFFGAGRTEDAAALVDRVGFDALISSPAASLAILGMLAARRGDRDRALALIDELATIGHSPYQHHNAPAGWRAAIAALLGERERAVEWLREHFAQGARFTTWWHRNPNLESLRGYPPYEELMRPKG